ncbi:MAG: transcription-repair coupling factor [Bacillota bacterium]|nr:transcription-repair coupling factor [Bacillota bacterium]
MIGDLLKLWHDHKSFKAIADSLKSKKSYRGVSIGLDGSARVYFMAALAARHGKKTVIITADMARAEKVYSELEAFLPGIVNIIPPREFFISAEILTRSDEMQHKRLRYLQWIISGETGIYVAPVSAFMSRALPPKMWNSLLVNLETGQNMNRQELIELLIKRGYERVSLTETPGQFSARGDIVDIFPPGLGNPVRLELYDEEIESLRSYDPATQRTTEKFQDITLLPARELILPESHLADGSRLIKKQLDKITSGLRRRDENDVASKLNQQITRHLERLTHPEGIDLLSSYLPFFYGAGASLLDYLPEDSLVIVEEPVDVTDKSRRLRNEIKEYNTGRVLEAELLDSGFDLLWRDKDLLARLPCHLIGCSLFSGTGGLFSAGESYTIETKAAPVYHGQWDLFKNDYENWIKEGFKIYLAADSEERGQGISAVMAEKIKECRDAQKGYTETDIFADLFKAELIIGKLEEGFIAPAIKLVVLTEQNIIPRRKRRRRVATKDEGIRLSDYRELAVGDYVVHEQHGIGLYQGLHTLEVSEIKRDYLLLKYRGTDKLYLPIDQVGMIQKYSGGDGPTPRLHSLGGAEWQRLKNRVNRSVEELARELLTLYAARQAVEGYQFGPDHPWQQEFEVNFPFEETPDQLRAIEEVKSDLEKNHPMDRLICGDVGYGKTEVAMRAAFKAVMDGKQVAILVPTTVLAQQHHRTFRERFNGFPVKIAQLSRFVSVAAQKQIVKDLAAGKIDVVIGTHRLLSKDILFHDLGLLVVDEEQRFGVKQKEKMKQMRLEVDTLAMTATPIPRTLHLSLAGARDFSIIDTPPEDRYPVQTYVVEYSENLIREAVQRELNRQGQIYIVFNRVLQIDAFAEKIQELFPGIEVAVGHGQMPEKQLERVMSDFQEGYYQILVSSTIIESGLDIPNVNTLIVCESDRYGLAQLYQLRGRVGRSNRLAYAYLTYRKEKIVSEAARKRLRAIKEFTELGSGFRIALRDLEIRGAGNILGAEQHGFIAEIGYDLYVKLLDQAVAELKNEKQEVKAEPRLELQVSAYLPSSYITVQDQKIDFYQRIFKASSYEDLTAIEEEMIDRFASPPEPVRALLKVAFLKLTSAGLGIELIRQKQNELIIQFGKSAVFNIAWLSHISAASNSRVKIMSRNPVSFKIVNTDKRLFSIDELVAMLNSFKTGNTLEAGSNRNV